MGYVSKEKSHFAEIAGPSFSEFVQLSSIHCDGWGIATVDSGTAVATLDKAAETACNSDQFDFALAGCEARNIFAPNYSRWNGSRLIALEVG